MSESNVTPASSKIPVLDLGYVELIDTFGSDLTVVNAARVSFHKEVTEMTERDGKLVKYLADHHHVTPFFHPQAQFRIKMPIFVAREWFRHQIGFARNEVSRRYVDEEPEMYLPEVVRARDKNLKQGSKSEPVGPHDRAKDTIRRANESALYAYQELLDMGTAPEVARTVLPQGMYTEFIETASLAAFHRLYNLRTSSDAQWEIRQYAEAIGKLLTPKFPVSWSALTKEPIHKE